ncbi:sensor histidine kinase [Ahrensia sp. R2A130]|uniref:sensor histidine kinase n=1 Tax=Ahrensia sp. R2A130 TaxID=744979 RepID=UPI0001E0BC72|nr:sensor histidine kinase [Ahrensia sp. R2A130]EFL89444.1 histidine kinase [Ahrensia sp. R2A130]
MFKITARTVLELGAELISSDIIAFYELIKNGFDAGSKSGVDIEFHVFIPRRESKFIEKEARRQGAVSELRKLALTTPMPLADAGLRIAFEAEVKAASTRQDVAAVVKAYELEHNYIVVADAGSGMSKAQLNDAFLVIGTTSRKVDVERALSAGQDDVPYLGEKGIGRLSTMRLGNRLTVETATEADSTLNLLDINWRDFGDLDAMMEDIAVAPVDGPAKPTPAWHGTRIIIRDLLEAWTEERVGELCRYDFARLTDPHANKRKRPKVRVTFNGEPASIPFMPTPLLDAAHAKISGSYEIHDGEPILRSITEVFSLGFDHPHESDTTVLTTSELQSTIIDSAGNVDDETLVALGDFKFEIFWYNRRRLSRVDSTGEAKSLRDLQNAWSGIMLFRDGFRVFPYGEDKDDWLDLDRKALRNRGYTLNKTQFIGRVNISRTKNPHLLDQTNREGLRVTPEQTAFLEILRWSVQDGLGGFMRDVEKRYKDQKVELGEAQTRVDSIEKRARQSIKQLRKFVPKEGREDLVALEQTLLELSDFANLAKKRIEEAEKEGRQLIDMAGIGLMVEVVAHELARSSENTLQTLSSLQTADVPEHVRAQLHTLQSQMKTLSKRIRILDPMSVNGRQTKDKFDLAALIHDVLDAHVSQFERHGISLDLDLGDKPVRVRAVKGMMIQILENLVSNSVHWMDLRQQRDATYKPTIRIVLESGPLTITYEDNGIGIAPDNAEKVFRPFFSLKEKKKRRGLGLFIAREIANYHDGTLLLSDVVNPDTKRCHRFVLEFPSKIEL